MVFSVPQVTILTGKDPFRPLYTVGSNAYRIDRIMTVRELMDELKGVKKPVESVA